MANIKSAKKRIELTRNRTVINKSKKTEIKTYIKKFESALNAGNVEEARVLIKAIDRKLKKAASKNIIQSNISKTSDLRSFTFFLPNTEFY